jgi:hypothetical protein
MLTEQAKVIFEFQNRCPRKNQKEVGWGIATKKQDQLENEYINWACALCSSFKRRLSTCSMVKTNRGIPPLELTEYQAPFEFDFDAPLQFQVQRYKEVFYLLDSVNQPNFKEPTAFMPLSIIGLGGLDDKEKYVLPKTPPASVFDTFGFEHLSAGDGSTDIGSDAISESSDVFSVSSDEDECGYFFPLAFWP